MRPARWIIAAIALIALAWTSLMGFVNTRTTLIQFDIAGGFSEVQVFKSTDTANPVARIVTDGVAKRQAVELRNAAAYSFLVQTAPAQYYFVARTAEASFQSGPICCVTGFTLAPRFTTVTIRGLNDWEQTQP